MIPNTKTQPLINEAYEHRTYILIYSAIINSLSADVKITGTASRYNMLGEKYYHNKKYQGISRPQQRDENCFPRIRSVSPASGSRAREDLQSTPRVTSDKTENNLSAARGARHSSAVELRTRGRRCITPKALPCRPSQNKCDVSAIKNELCV